MTGSRPSGGGAAPTMRLQEDTRSGILSITASAIGSAQDCGLSLDVTTTQTNQVVNVFGYINVQRTSGAGTTYTYFEIFVNGSFHSRLAQTTLKDGDYYGQTFVKPITLTGAPGTYTVAIYAYNNTAGLTIQLQADSTLQIQRIA